MIIRLSSGVACAALLALAAAQAQAAPSARATDLAKRYIAALHMENMMGEMMKNMAPAILDDVARQRGGAVPSEMRAAFTSAAEDSARAMTPKMMDRIIPVVAESFTEAELAAAVAYYESPLGQAFLAKSPAFMAKATPAMMELMPAYQADMMGRFCKSVGCNPADLK